MNTTKVTVTDEQTGNIFKTIYGLSHEEQTKYLHLLQKAVTEAVENGTEMPSPGKIISRSRLDERIRKSTKLEKDLKEKIDSSRPKLEPNISRVKICSFPIKGIVTKSALILCPFLGVFLQCKLGDDHFSRIGGAMVAIALLIGFSRIILEKEAQKQSTFRSLSKSFALAHRAKTKYILRKIQLESARNLYTESPSYIEHTENMDMIDELLEQDVVLESNMNNFMGNTKKKFSHNEFLIAGIGTLIWAYGNTLPIGSWFCAA